MALVLLVSQLLGKNLLRTLVGKQLHLPDPVWQRLGYAWILFLTLTAWPTCTSPTPSPPPPG